MYIIYGNYISPTSCFKYLNCLNELISSLHNQVVLQIYTRISLFVLVHRLFPMCESPTLGYGARFVIHVASRHTVVVPS